MTTTCASVLCAMLLLVGCGADEPAADGPGRALPFGRSSEVELARERFDLILEVLDDGPPGITDSAVLEAMVRVPRHPFVRPDKTPDAYRNRPVPIGRGDGQVSSKPYLVALMTQALRLTGTERVLEIGTGTGWHAAILSHLASHVTTVEIDPGLCERARSLLERHAATRVRVVCADGRDGHPEGAPYDAIVVTAGVPEIPEALLAQLAPGGRIVAPVGVRGVQEGRSQMLVLVEQKQTRTTYELAPVRFHMLR